MIKPAWSNPVTHELLLSGFPFVRLVPTKVRLTIDDRLGSQDPNSTGLILWEQSALIPLYVPRTYFIYSLSERWERKVRTNWQRIDDEDRERRHGLLV